RQRLRRPSGQLDGPLQGRRGGRAAAPRHRRGIRSAGRRRPRQPGRPRRIAGRGYTPVVVRGYSAWTFVTTLIRYGADALKARLRAGAISLGVVTSSPAPPRALTTWSYRVSGLRSAATS